MSSLFKECLWSVWQYFSILFRALILGVISGYVYTKINPEAAFQVAYMDALLLTLVIEHIDLKWRSR